MAVQDPQPLPTVRLSSDLEKNAALVDVTPLDDRRLLIQSPYTEPDHQLDLDTLDNENEILARALTILTATRQDYATAPYNDSFNWPEVIDESRRLIKESGRGFQETIFYIVAFRSQIKPSTDYSHLGQLDKAAHKEAIDSGGFLKYWFGSPDTDLRNLATCVWTSRDHAFAGGRGPAHRKAAHSTRALYAEWKIDQHRLTIGRDAETWSLDPWE
ncbi:hypothetical protein B0I35DRAFT_347103 [Stachybotrys elegans]|uniref:Uncharacterized protein n=1 Tax=Stachybotrys elegans TaxID=80388 RepID=A0A8K0WV56_9HYPO|nr:hypothetical protein B0I35DRAFT_347103 [Stachybotrys elegans]